MGHVVFEEGINTNIAKIQVVEAWPVSKNVKDVSRFPGFTTYKQQLIQGF